LIVGERVISTGGRNLFVGKVFHPRGRLAYRLEMSTGHFLEALPYKLINSGTSVIFSRAYIIISQIHPAFAGPPAEKSAQ